MRKRKLNLKDLKVESFITSFDGDTARTVQGGKIQKLPHSYDNESVIIKDGGCYM